MSTNPSQAPSVQLSLLPSTTSEAEFAMLSLEQLPRVLVPVTGQFVQSVKDFGVLEPILVARNGCDMLVVQDGRRRVQAARLAGLKEVPAMISQLSWCDPSVVALTANANRSPNHAGELEAIEQLLEQGASESDIAQATGMAISTIRARLRLRDLIPELRSAWESGHMSTSTAVQATRLNETQQTRLADSRDDEDSRITAQDVEQIIQARTSNQVALLPDELFERDELTAVETKRSLSRIQPRLSILGSPRPTHTVSDPNTATHVLLEVTTEIGTDRECSLSVTIPQDELVQFLLQRGTFFSTAPASKEEAHAIAS